VSEDRFDSLVPSALSETRESPSRRYSWVVPVIAFLVGGGATAWLAVTEDPSESQPQGEALAALVRQEREDAQGSAWELSPLDEGSRVVGASERAAAATAPADEEAAQLDADEAPPAPELADVASDTPLPPPVSVAQAPEPELSAATDRGEEGATPATEPSDPTEGYFIQVASLRLKETADDLAADLRKQGHPAQSVPYGQSGGKWWHVVRIGPFQTRVEAEARRLALDPVSRGSATVFPRARGHFHVQVASLRSRDRAVEVLNQLLQRGYVARVSAVQGADGGRWHCVRVGPLDSRSEAEQLRALLKSRDGVDGQVIPFGPPDESAEAAMAALGTSPAALGR